MGLALQESGIGSVTWRDWIGRMPGFAKLEPEVVNSVLHHMIDQGILWSDEGILWFGREGEARFGRKHFLSLLSAFTSPPLFSVRFGRTEIGSVHQLSLMARTGERPVLSLGGRSWEVTQVEWLKRIAQVQPASGGGKSRWLGGDRPLLYPLCQAIRGVLAADSVEPTWSARARSQISKLRDDFSWLDNAGTYFLTDQDGSTKWWTFGGYRANASIAQCLNQQLHVGTQCDDLAISLGQTVAPEECARVLHDVVGVSGFQIAPFVPEEALRELKFSDCLPSDLAKAVVGERSTDVEAVAAIISAPARYIRSSISRNGGGIPPP